MHFSRRMPHTPFPFFYGVQGVKHIIPRYWFLPFLPFARRMCNGRCSKQGCVLCGNCDRETYRDYFGNTHTWCFFYSQCAFVYFNLRLSYKTEQFFLRTATHMRYPSLPRTCWQVRSGIFMSREWAHRAMHDATICPGTGEPSAIPDQHRTVCCEKCTTTQRLPLRGIVQSTRPSIVIINYLIM
jgi:hypothetical protein